jgi:hypothetical protein
VTEPKNGNAPLSPPSAAVCCSARHAVGTLAFPRSIVLEPPPCPAPPHRVFTHHRRQGEAISTGKALPTSQLLRLTARLPHGFLADFAHDGGDGLVGLEMPCEDVGRRGQHTVPKEAGEILPQPLPNVELE